MSGVAREESPAHPRHRGTPVPIVGAVVLAGSPTREPGSRVGDQPVAMAHNVNPAVADSTRMGDMPDDATMSLAVSLKLHDEAGLQQFLAQVARPSLADVPPLPHALPVHGQLRPHAVRRRDRHDLPHLAGPDREARVGQPPGGGRSGPVSAARRRVRHAHRHVPQQGREFYANDSAPTMPSDVAAVVQGISGLDNHAVRHPTRCPAVPRPAAAPNTARHTAPRRRRRIGRRPGSRRASCTPRTTRRLAGHRQR